MFARARRRLALRYLVLIAVVLAAFSVAFLAVLAVVLRPAFDLAPEFPNNAAARAAYRLAMERIAIALGVVNIVALASLGTAAYYLADRTLRPIRDAHDRQRRFVADASHEMRGPLTAIHGTAEAALGSLADPSATQRALATILEATRRLGRLTTDLLLLARTEQGALTPATGLVDLSVVVAEEITRIQPAKPTPRPAMAVLLCEDVVVRADPDDLARIVGNLLDNAVRYGRDPYSVTTGVTDGVAVLEVGDHGPGLDPADLERVFEPFYRVRADASAPSGTGLGLAIARELAHRHGGRLTVQSSPGSGARFRLEIPRAR